MTTQLGLLLLLAACGTVDTVLLQTDGEPDRMVPAASLPDAIRWYQLGNGRRIAVGRIEAHKYFNGSIAEILVYGVDGQYLSSTMAPPPLSP